MTSFRLVSALLFLAPTLAAQDGPLALPGRPEEAREIGKRAQTQFENFRRANLPSFRGGRPQQCQETVGRFCYWYDEKGGDVVVEPERVTAARARLITLLDSLGRSDPADRWLSGQRVRYLVEHGRLADALTVAQECKAELWWCHGINGFALHALGRYVAAETAYEQLLGLLSPRDRCRWRDIGLYLDDDTRRTYVRTNCGEAARQAFEDRVWWYARTRYGFAGNDSRSEHYSRLMYAEFLGDASSVHQFGFDADERELLLRFGWPTGWSRGPGDPRARGPQAISVVGHEPVPAYRYIPPYTILANPANSDSTDWALQLPPVVARYAPPYARRLLMLEHQQALFRRGDTALVVLGYDVSKIPSMRNATLDGALVLTPGLTPRPSQTLKEAIPPRGVLLVRAPWGPLLMSAEIAAPATSTLARARYGIRPPYAIGTRVSLSDLLFFAPYGTFPTSVEEVIPHMHTTEKLRANQPLGVYWEAYNTNPEGERMTISLTVSAEEVEETGLFRRGARAMRMGRSAAPVSITVEDLSARGSRTSTRALQLDISTLRRGSYIVQLEISVAGQYVIRADRRIEIVEN